jgi:hypothetical protein
MRARQELEMLGAPADIEAPGGRCELRFDLPLHSVSLLLFLPAGPAAADALAVTGLRAEHFSGLHETGEWLLRWDALPTRSLRTYIVLRAETPAGPFNPLPLPDLLCSAWLVTQPGAYAVLAADHWGRQGPQSQVLQVA